MYSRLFEEVLKLSGRIREMAAVGEIEDPKAGHHYLEVFSGENKDETPHVNLEKPCGNKRKMVMAKIVIPSQQPGENDEPNFLWIRENFTIHNSLKKEIQKWFVKIDNGQTGWWWADNLWRKQAQSISWGQLKK